MLFHIQFPFTDLRPLSTPPTPRIKVPSWPAPIVDDLEFVRAFGIVRRRTEGGLSGIGETAYCDARRALRFPGGALDRVNGSANAAQGVALDAAFRRLFFDGYATGKMEIGLRPTTLPPETAAMTDLLTRVLTIRTAVRTTDGSPHDPPLSKEYPLFEAGPPLARFYALATSEIVERRDSEIVARRQLQDLSSFVRGEAPMVFIEVSAEEANRVNLPSEAREIPILASPDFKLLFWRRLVSGKTIAVWCAILEKEVAGPLARNLRIYLLRLNAEHQALKRTLKEMAQGHIAPTARSDESQRLQQYLNDATRRIGDFENKTRAYAAELGKLAFSVWDAAEPGERDALLQRLQVIDVRGNIFRKIADYAKQQPISLTIVEGDQMTTEHGDITNIKDSTGVVFKSTNVQQNINSTLTNVQQSIGSIPGANEDDRKQLQKLIEDLNAKLKEGLEKASKGPDAEAVAKKAEDVAEHAASLVQTAAQEKPNKTMLQTISGGLKTTAEFLKDTIPSAVTIAAQIASVVGKIFGLPV